MTMGVWQMACNRTEWACGCVTWHELSPGGSWITRRWAVQPS